MENQKTQIVTKLKEANNVLVTVSRNPTVDQLAAAIGLTLALNKLGKHATAVFSGEVPSTIEFLQPEDTLEQTTDSLRDFIIALDKSKADKLRYKVEDRMVKIFITPYRTSINQEDLQFSQGDFNVDVIMALGVHDQNDLDDAIISHGRILHDATIVSVTTRDASALGTIHWANPQASSLCEMLVPITEAMKQDILDNQMATAFLTGIVAETNRFSNDRTTSETMNVSAVLMSAGANQQLIATKLQQHTEAPAPLAPPAPVVQQQEMAQDGSLQVEHTAPSRAAAPTSPSIVPEHHDEPHRDEILMDEHGTLIPPSETPTKRVIQPLTPPPPPPQMPVSQIVAQQQQQGPPPLTNNRPPFGPQPPFGVPAGLPPMPPMMPPQQGWPNQAPFMNQQPMGMQQGMGVPMPPPNPFMPGGQPNPFGPPPNPFAPPVNQFAPPPPPPPQQPFSPPQPAFSPPPVPQFAPEPPRQFAPPPPPYEPPAPVDLPPPPMPEPPPMIEQLAPPVPVQDPSSFVVEHEHTPPPLPEPEQYEEEQPEPYQPPHDEPPQVEMPVPEPVELPEPTPVELPSLPAPEEPEEEEELPPLPPREVKPLEVEKHSRMMLDPANEPISNAEDEGEVADVLNTPPKVLPVEPVAKPSEEEPVQPEEQVSEPAPEPEITPEPVATPEPTPEPPTEEHANEQSAEPSLEQLAQEVHADLPPVVTDREGSAQTLADLESEVASPHVTDPAQTKEQVAQEATDSARNAVESALAPKKEDEVPPQKPEVPAPATTEEDHDQTLADIEKEVASPAAITIDPLTGSMSYAPATEAKPKDDSPNSDLGAPPAVPPPMVPPVS